MSMAIWILLEISYADEKWRYFTGVQAPLDCSEYNTDDLRKAFAGDVCYNGREESTVQP